MYGWIWQKLPFGLPGKIIGSLVLVVGIGLALWFLLFPVADTWLPSNDVQVTGSPHPTPTTSSTGAQLPGN
jgi:predicted membrane protein